MFLKIKKSLMALGRRALLLFTFIGTYAAHAADLNVLIIGSSKDSTTSGYVAGNSKPFSPAQIRTELQNILAGANLGTVNVTLIDRGVDNNTHSLASWYHYPYPADVETTTRWPNLRGELGTQWDYVVLIGDPYTMEKMPGLYTQGVASIAEEVAAGSAETILLMPWPASTSTSTVDHYKEVVYRTGRTAGIKVAPAGLAWRDAGSSAGATHPTANGAFIAAASIYSTIWNQSAKSSTYTYNDGLADTVHQTVTNSNGAQQYTGPFTFQNPFLMLGDKRRFIYYSDIGTSTEKALMNGAAEALSICKVGYNKDAFNDTYYSNTPLDDGMGWPTKIAVPIAWNHGRSGQYKLNPDFWQIGFGYVYQSYTWDNTVAEGNDIEISRFFTYDVDLADTMISQGPTARAIPWRLMLAQIHKKYPSIKPLADGDGPHQNAILTEASGAYMYTLYSGRCPLEKKPEYPLMSWYSQKIAYETAWRMGRCQSRAPGFKVMPSASTALTITPTTSETMSVQFILPPQQNVTVSVDVDKATAAIVNPRQLTFTPDNHDIAQSVKVVGLPGVASSEGFAVNFNTSSSDEVYDALNDSWTYTNNRNPIQTLTVQTLADQQVNLLKNTTSTISLNVAGSAQANTLIAQPIHGSLTWSGANVIYMPNADFFGTDSFAYAVNVGGILTKGYVMITVEDLPKIAITETDGQTVVTEGGATDTYRVTLNKAPAANVSVALAGDSQVTVSPSTLSFSAANWNVPQTVTVTAVNDAAHELLHSGLIRHTTSSSASAWNGLISDLTATVRDNDNLAPVVNAGPDQTVVLSYNGSDSGVSPVAGAHFEWDAAVDTTGDDIWPSISGNELNWEFFDGDISPSVLKDARFTKLTNAYSFPAARSTFYSPFDADARSSATFEFVVDVDGNDGSILFNAASWGGLQIDIVSGVLRGSVGAGAALSQATYALTSNDMGRFIHVVFVIDVGRDVTELFVDGELKDSKTLLATDWALGGMAAYLGTVGSFAHTLPVGGSTADFTGKMALFRYYSQIALNPQEVITNFNSLSSGMSATINLDGTVTDSNNDPLTHTWTTTSSTGLAAFGDSSAIDTTATFTTPGVYTLRLNSNDGQENVYDELTVTVIGPYSKSSLIYEPFDQDEGALGGQPTSSMGLNRKWNSQLVVQSNGLSYGNLPVRGRSIANGARRQLGNAEVDDSLRSAGLLQNGAELWFSILHKIAPSNNAEAQLSFGLTSHNFGYGQVSNFYDTAGEGIGFYISKGDELRAATWKGTNTPNMTADSATLDLVPAVAPFGSTILIVGKITWGATNTALDKIDIYLPNTNFDLGPVVSTVSASIDQSTMNMIAIGGPSNNAGVCQHIDEIRFDATYADVLTPGRSLTDTTFPTPNPLTWVNPPTATSDSSITMRAVTATDVSGVEYYFTETSGNPGGSDSGWQDSTMYTDTGLYPSTTYSYTVKARDKSIKRNETAGSSLAAATTPVDTTSPTPNPMTWASPPTALGDSRISMTATTATDVSGVEYYFTETSGNPGGSDSGWQDSPTFTLTNLNSSTTYSYTVKARDKSINRNETAGTSPVASAATSITDTIAPATPTFATPPTSISPTGITMTANAVTDPSGVEYYFTVTSVTPGGSDSGWQDSPTYTDTSVNPSYTYSYTVKARDKSRNQNESAPSAAAFTTTQADPQGPTAYYWDQNGLTALFGTAGGTWDTSGLSTWNATAAGDVGPIVAITTSTLNTLSFGNATASSLLSGVITVGGTVSSGNMTFGAGAGSITLSGGTINFAAASTITTNSASIATINSVISGAGTTLTKGGAGILVLSGINTYSGQTWIDLGTLRVGSISNIGGTGTIRMGATTTTGTLEYTGVEESSARDIQINSSVSAQTGGAAILNNGSGALTFTAANFNAAYVNGSASTRVLTLGGSNGGEIQGIIQNNSATSLVGVTKSGTGTWALSGANIYTGVTTVNSGILRLNYATNNNSKLGDSGALLLNGGRLDLAGGSHNEVVFNAVTGGGTTFVTRSSGSGILDLGQINSLTQAASTNSTTTVTVADSSVLRVGMRITGTGIPANATITSIVDPTTITISAAATATGSITATLGTASLTAGAVDFAENNIAKTFTLNHSSGALASAAGAYRLTVAGANWAKNDGLGNIVAYTGYEAGNYAGGAMTADKNYALVDGAAIATNQGATTNTLKITTSTTGQSIAISTGATFTLGSMLFAGANDYAISTAGTGKIAATLLHNYGAGSLTLGTLGAALTQYGTGKTILNGGNALGDYAMVIAGGTVQISSNLQIGTNASSTVKGVTLNNGTLLASENLALEAGVGIRPRPVALGEGGGTLAAASTKTLTVSGVISGTGLLTVGSVGNTGTVALTGINTYTGRTSVNYGTLGGTGSIAGSVTVAAAGSLAPGVSAGTLSIGGGLDISAPVDGGAGKLKYELGPIASSDKLVVTGTLTIGTGKLGFSDFVFDGITGLEDGIYKLITSGGISGTLDTVPANLTGLIEGGPVRGTLQITGNDLELVVTGTGTGNTVPTISDIANQSLSSSGTVGALAFTVGDAQTAVGSLQVAGSSSNTSLVPNANIVFGGSGANRTITVTPVSGLSGTTTITVTVSDGVLTAQDTFTLSVNAMYLSWATGAESFGGDANRDGVADGMAWILGASSPSVNASTLLPAQNKDESFLSLNFKRVNVYSPAKLYLQFGYDLTNWTEYEIPATSNSNIGEGIEVIVVKDLPNPDQVTVKVPTALESTKGTLFLRLSATNN